MTRLGLSQKRLDAFNDCGKGLYAEIREDGQKVRVFCSRCKDRWCIPCQNARGYTIAANLNEHLGNRDVTHWTLTLRSSNTPLADQIRRLKQSFHELRRRPIWKNNVSGGAFFFEVTLGENGLWHPHLHVICAAKFIDHKALSLTWHAVTGDSSVVYVKFYRTGEKLTSYVTKYVSKPIEANLYKDRSRLQEAMIALRSTRGCNTFGDWNGLKLTKRKPDGFRWKPLGHVPSIFLKARAQDQSAMRVVRALLDQYPGLSVFERLELSG